MGKGSNVPAPNPKLVQAQIKSMGVQDAATQEILRIAQEQSAQQAELIPLQKDQLQTALDANKAALQQTQEDRAYNIGQRDKFTKQTDAMVAEADAYDSEAMQAKRAMEASAGVGKSYSDAIQASDRELASMGLTPGSGRQIAIREGNAAKLAATTVGSSNLAREGARQEGRYLQDRAASALAGAPGAAADSTMSGARLAAGGVDTVNAGAGGIYSGYGVRTGQQQAAGGLAGAMGSNATNMWNAQAQYKLATDKANENDWGGLAGGLGALAGGAARLAPLFMGSERAYKQDIQLIGKHVLGFGIYQFQYRPEFRERWGEGVHEGVMADEVRDVRPDAVGIDADGFTVIDYSKLRVK